jgi:hypothetical protein
MKLTSSQLKLVGLLIALGAFIGLFAWLDKNPIIGWDFRHNLWAPASLLVKGQSPYDVKVLYDAGLAMWMPMAIGALFPLGWLSLSHAGNIWFLFSLLALVIVIWLSTSGKKVPPLFLAIIALAVALFPPTITHLVLGQITLIICLLYLIVVLLLDKSRILLACFLIAFSLAKPQLSILVLPGILISYQREKGTKATFAFIALIILCSAVFTIPLFVGFPTWIADFIASIRQNPDFLQPSLFSLLPVWFGDAGYIIWGLTAITVFAVNIWLWLSKKREDAIYWSLALTPLVTPYVWSLLFSAYCLCWILNLYISFRTDVSNHRYWPIPWIILMAIGAIHISKDILPSMTKGHTSTVIRFFRQK